MSEERVVFESDGLKLEGLFDNLQTDKGVVVTHPHPQYGGDMHNIVVDAVCQAYKDMGYSTFRFNFRSVEGSEGNYDSGQGEQNDIQAALQYLADQGITSIDLVAYSFGAWVTALGLEKLDLANRLIFISPPVTYLDFTFLDYDPRLQLIIAGQEDDIAQQETIDTMMLNWEKRVDFRVMEDTDHFFFGKTDELKSILKEFLNNA
jgi:uncharacterized protein